ncbi:hypothetical protein SLEP1_g33048 [Rubroshorea leprosula]|uniref:Uncharacterized protein n=1 Tax=Rubroshorea leprosula TaxID=152421 RepID=A0AAV5KFD3_9ROSI|nr:hypothetical protein SLEP1_g33048 [Rubroshorea leprosula]
MDAQNNENSNAIMAQLEAPAPQATLVANTSMPNQDTSQSEAAKRARDQAYRVRLKKDKTEMMDNMKALTQENKALWDENGNLQSENTDMNKVLQSQAKEIDQLQRDFDLLKHENKKQNLLMQILSEKLDDSDLSLREENQKLQNENYWLRQSMGMDNPSLQLIEESVQLKHENRVMKAQVSALCEKLIISENLSSPAKFMD